MNSFDVAVLLAVVLLAALGFRAGLMRSLADIFGYLIAAPIAVAAAHYLAPNAATGAPWGQNSLVFFGIFIVAGLLMARLLRLAIGDMLGHDIHLLDRSAGCLLGIVRALLVAMTIVLVFDQMIPAGREPTFLKDSRLRPLLSLAAQRGLRSLPPDMTKYIDQLKRERRL